MGNIQVSDTRLYVRDVYESMVAADEINLTWMDNVMQTHLNTHRIS